LLVGDFIVASIALFAALYFWGSADRFPSFGLEWIRTRPPTWFFALPLVWMFLLIEQYDARRAADWGKTVRGVAAAALLFILLYLLLYFYYVEPPRNMVPRRGIAGFLVSATVLTLAWRWTYIRIFTTPRFMRRVLLVGGGRSGQIFLKILNDLWPPPFFMVGVVDDDQRKLGTELEGVPVIATSENLHDLIQKNSISDIIVAISGELQPCMFEALLYAQERGIEITRMPVAYEELLGRVPIRLLEADWILRSFVDQARVNGFYELSKRLLDIVGGLIGTLLMLVMLPFLGIAIVLDDGFPVFFSQTRAGRGGQPYNILKLRTMRRDAEADGEPQWAKEDDQRATRTGRFLRRTHLDEIPQVLNVVRGDMSLVGPRAERPELMEMFQRNVPFYRARLLVKPGITGWAQVNFGYASSIEETIMKLEYDLYYIKRRNLALDLLIMLRTPFWMLGFRGR
jgi:exopolysaccharide biosynthesis polyprenyl glycosylphosphotransferase